MFETMQPDPPLATARDLAAFHARRERFYDAAARLLTAPLDRAAPVELRRRGDRIAVDAADTRPAADLEFAALFGAGAGSIDLRCPDPAAPTRQAALEHTAVRTATDIPAELRVLAVLAHRTAAAIEYGDIAEAATLVDVQARFLRHHAAACIRGLAAQLIAAALPCYAALGRALAAQVDSDLHLLSF